MTAGGAVHRSWSGWTARRIPRRILRDDAYAAARPVAGPPGRCGLAAVHRIAPDTVDGPARAGPGRAVPAAARRAGRAPPRLRAGAAVAGGEPPGRRRRRGGGPRRLPDWATCIVGPGGAPGRARLGAGPPGATRSRTSAGSVCGPGASARRAGPAGVGRSTTCWPATPRRAARRRPCGGPWWEAYGTLQLGGDLHRCRPSTHLGRCHPVGGAGRHRPPGRGERGGPARAGGGARSDYEPTGSPSERRRRPAGPHDRPTAAELLEAVGEYLEQVRGAVDGAGGRSTPASPATWWPMVRPRARARPGPGRRPRRPARPARRRRRRRARPGHPRRRARRPDRTR